MVIVRAFGCVAALSLFLTPVLSFAQTPSDLSPRSLAAAASEVRVLDRALAQSDDPLAQDAIAERAAVTARSARADLAGLQSDLRRIEDQSAHLGPPRKGVVEAPDIRERRADLTRRHDVIDSAIKRARLISGEADQIVAEVERRRSRAFNAMLSTRLTSPLLPAFWRPIVDALPESLHRLDGLMSAQAGTTWRGLQAVTVWPAMLGLIAAGLLVFPLRTALRRGGRRVMIEQAPSSRLRRSGLALWLTAANTILAWLGSVVLVQGFAGAGMLDPTWQPLAASFELAVSMAALVNALGGALLQRNRPSWRLTPVGDRSAARLRPWTQIAAGTACLTILSTALVETAGLPAPVRNASDLCITILHLALMLGILLVIGRIRIEATAETKDDTRDDRSLAGIALVSLAAWAGVGAATIALAAGYVALALMLSRLLLWLPTVAAALYLLLIAVDDLCSELIAGKSVLGRTMHDAFGLRHSVIDQASVALSATLRVLLLLTAAGIAFAPFGANLGKLVETVEDLGHGITFGEVTIAPLAILRAIVVLAAGLVVVRTIRRWLTDRYLPTTELDPGARNSIVTVASYLGIILVGLWSLTALGIGFQRIALILSALSVGIGFGLQAITQNFVSGLILLIERPVKIGDLVRVGDQEGDVKRINVRATEIVTGDRSTLIVPNSELITKTVRNMTLADPIGRVQIRFAIPLGPNIAAVRRIMSDLFATTPAVLTEPAPSIALDSLEDGAAHYNCVGYVASPRQAAAVRSDLLFRLVDALEDAGIDLSSPSSPRTPAFAVAMDE